MKKTLLLFFFIISTTGWALSQTYPSALIQSDQTWKASGSPYVINQNTYVDTGVTLTIEPGTVIQGKPGNKYISLIVDGTLVANGNQDSLIVFDSIEVKPYYYCVNYDTATGTGTQFSYCHFMGGAQRSIYTLTKSLWVTHSIFEDNFYGVYTGSSGSDGLIYIDSCVFRNISYPIMSTAHYKDLHVHNSVFFTDNKWVNPRLYLYGQLDVKHNYFLDCNLSIYAYQKSEFSCNYIDKPAGTTGVALGHNGQGLSGIQFNNNTINTRGTKSTVPLLSLTNNTRHDSTTLSNFDDNNFLMDSIVTEAVRITWQNDNFNTTSPMYFRNCYWSTTDTTRIDALITDYKDNIVILPTVDYSNYTSSPDFYCMSDLLICKPAMSYSVQGDTVTFNDNSYSSFEHSVTWDFGDGESSTEMNPVHEYDSAGSYTVCMIFSDIYSYCTDTICKTVIVGGSGSSCKAYFTLDTDTSNVYKLKVLNKSSGVSSSTVYSWDFGDGGSGSGVTPSHTYQAAGTYVLCLSIVDTSSNCYSTYCDTIVVDSTGINGYSLDVIDLVNGNTSTGDDLKNEIKIFPNPTTGKIYLESISGHLRVVSIDVRNLLGQVVKHYTNRDLEVNELLELDIRDLDPGIYLLDVRGADKRATFKVLLNK